MVITDELDIRPTADRFAVRVPMTFPMNDHRRTACVEFTLEPDLHLKTLH
jgi:hypothetical protein